MEQWTDVVSKNRHELSPHQSLHHGPVISSEGIHLPKKQSEIQALQGPEEEKVDRIKEPSSIFIDDSFSERARVKRKLGIPVFSADAVESLIDWRV